VEFFVIGEEEIVLGFRFAGIGGAAVTDRDGARAAFREVTGRGTVGVLILTEEVSALLEPEVTEWQVKAEYPLVVEIPGLQGRLPGKKTLLESIREAIGIHV
jgi:vacuolar-type H+-ATPase subunit F/Vma7